MGAECCSNKSARNEASTSLAVCEDAKKPHKLRDDGKRHARKDSASRRVPSRRPSPPRSGSLNAPVSGSEPLPVAHCRLAYGPINKAASEKLQVYHVHEVLEFNAKSSDLRSRGRGTARNVSPEDSGVAKNPDTSMASALDRSDVDERPYQAYLMKPKKKQEH